MAMEKWIAVMAGTPVDSEMGVAVLEKHGIVGRAYAMAADPIAQTAFQNQKMAVKMDVIRDTLSEIRVCGTEKVFVYCNSLSGAVDFETLANESGMQIITPLTVYRQLAQNYTRLGVIAANAQGLAGIERTLYAANPALHVLGATLLRVVEAIEMSEKPQDIVRRYGLAALIEWYAACDLEAVILGCTHFPYFKDELSKQSALPMIDPAEEMVRLLKVD